MRHSRRWNISATLLNFPKEQIPIITVDCEAMLLPPMNIYSASDRYSASPSLSIIFLRCVRLAPGASHLTNRMLIQTTVQIAGRKAKTLLYTLFALELLCKLGFTTASVILAKCAHLMVSRSTFPMLTQSSTNRLVLLRRC